MKTTKSWISIALGAVIALQSCRKSEDEIPVTPNTPGKTVNYVALVTTDLDKHTGMLFRSDKALSGLVDIGKVSQAQQITNARPGGVAFQDAIYLGEKSDGTPGIAKYIINAAGKIEAAGFVASLSTGGYNTKIYIENANLGFYADPTAGNLKLQTFNPATMARTGEIDLSVVSKKASNSSIKAEKLGDRMICAKEGKLYVDIQYDLNTNGFGASAYDEVFVAVIDIATKKYEKTISLAGAQEIAYPPNNLHMALVDANGDLYINTMGNMSKDDRNGKILRIKKGQTEFDKNFVINIDDYVTAKGIKWFHGGAAVINGKIITGIKQTPFANDYSNFNEENIVFHAIDINTKVATPIANVPVTNYTTICTPYYQDGKMMIPYSNKQGSGIYSFDGNTAKEEFKLSSGVISGYFKLEK